MDNKFKSFLVLAKLYERPKEDVAKILQMLEPQANQPNKAELYELFSGDNLNPLCESVCDTIQDKFDDIFTENELTELIQIFSSPVINKWLNFQNIVAGSIDAAYVKWITDTVNNYYDNK